MFDLHCTTALVLVVLCWGARCQPNDTSTLEEVFTDQPCSMQIDLEFINQTTNHVIPFETLLSEQVCEIDNLLDQIVNVDQLQLADDFELINTTRVGSIDETFAILNNLISIGRNMSKPFSSLTQRLISRFSFLLYEIQVSPQCMASLVSLITAVRNNELWALKFFDATGKIPSGILEGLFSSIGDYEQCLSIESGPGNSESKQNSFVGQYCFAQPIIPYPDRHNQSKVNHRNNPFGVPVSLIDDIADVLDLINGTLFYYGICIPSTCGAEEIQFAINKILYPTLKIPIQIGPQCITKHSSVTIDNYQWTSIITFLCLFTMTVLASVYEWVVCRTQSDQPNQKVEHDVDTKLNTVLTSQLPPDTNNNSNVIQTDPKKPSLLSQIIIAFSLAGNTRAMFYVSPAKFSSIDFIRFVMLVEISLMHNYYVAVGWSAWPLTKHFATGLFPQFATESRYAFLRNIHNTDFFFALSGLLLAYTTFRNLEKSQGKFNYLLYVTNVYLRFYPAVLGSILMYYLLPLFGDGPFWPFVDAYYVKSCRDSWMSTLLSYNILTIDMETFTNNSMCNVASWWITSVFHLFLLAPIILVPLYRSKKAVYLVFLAIIIGCAASVGHMVWKGIPFMNQVSRMQSITEESFYSIFYSWPFHHHIASFCLGILAGYLIRYYPNMPLGGTLGELLLASSFVGLSALGFYWTQDLIRSAPIDPSKGFDQMPVVSNLEIYLNITAGKLMFCSGFLCIFYFCCTKRLEWLNRMLTCVTLQPLYSLSLGIYLTNFLAPIFTIFTTRHLIEFSDHILIRNFTFNFALTIILSYILHVLFEKPVMNIVKIFEQR